MEEKSAREETEQIPMDEKSLSRRQWRVRSEDGHWTLALELTYWKSQNLERTNNSWELFQDRTGREVGNVKQTLLQEGMALQRE